MLASAGDDGNVIFWVPSDAAKPTAMGDDHLEDKETWREKHMCRTSSGAEIYDLAWSPDGVFIITGGVDNTARIFNAHTGKLMRQEGVDPSTHMKQVLWSVKLQSIITTCKVSLGTR
jgi:chromatin assembly factor 1 subunit B